jgi:hypothetical protein
MRPVRLIAAAVCFVACAHGAPALAQLTDRETIPRELFDGFCASWGPPSKVFSGELPRDFPTELIPDHSRVVGAVVSINSTTAIFSVPDFGGAAAAVEGRAEKAGWHVRPYEMDGFIPSGAPELNGPRCHQGRALNVVPVQTPDSFLRIDLIENGACKEPPGALERRAMPLPHLQVPDGTWMTGNGSMSGGSSDGSSYEARSATIQSTLSADALAAQFSDQASRAGWHATLVTGRPDLGVWTFERRGDGDAELVALLTVFRLRDGEYFAQFQAGDSGGKRKVVTSTPSLPPR